MSGDGARDSQFTPERLGPHSATWKGAAANSQWVLRSLGTGDLGAWALARRNSGGAAAGSWGPHKPRGPVTVSGHLGSNTLTVKPEAPNLPFEVYPSLPPTKEAGHALHLSLGNRRLRNRPFLGFSFPIVRGLGDTG
jgi:hypothetical protein